MTWRKQRIQFLNNARVPNYRTGNQIVKATCRTHPSNMRWLCFIDDDDEGSNGRRKYDNNGTYEEKKGIDPWQQHQLRPIIYSIQMHSIRLGKKRKSDEMRWNSKHSIIPWSSFLAWNLMKNFEGKRFVVFDENFRKNVKNRKAFYFFAYIERI